MYGKVMSLPDKAMGIYHKLILGWTPAQVEELERKLQSGELHPNDAKMNLAGEIVSIFHGEAPMRKRRKAAGTRCSGAAAASRMILTRRWSRLPKKIRDILVRLQHGWQPRRSQTTYSAEWRAAERRKSG